MVRLNCFRYGPPEGFEVVPPSQGKVGEILADALAKPNKEIWLVAVPRDASFLIHDSKK